MQPPQVRTLAWSRCHPMHCNGQTGLQQATACNLKKFRLDIWMYFQNHFLKIFLYGSHNWFDIPTFSGEIHSPCHGICCEWHYGGRRPRNYIHLFRFRLWPWKKITLYINRPSVTLTKTTASVSASDQARQNVIKATVSNPSASLVPCNSKLSENEQQLQFEYRPLRLIKNFFFNPLPVDVFFFQWIWNFLCKTPDNVHCSLFWK